MATKYFALLTNIGAAKLANATALGAQVEITQMAVGDGNGALPTPNPAQTALVHELRRAQLNMLTVDPVNTNQIIAEQVIPEDAGGWWIREIGLFDKDGDMIAVANCAETYKPQLQEGSGRVQVIRVILIVSSTEAVTLKIDPSVVLATRKYVDDAVIEVKAYADDVMKKHVAAANPHKQYPLIANALKEMVDAGLVNQVLQNLGLGEAATRNVGTGTGQVPDMSSFTTGHSGAADWPIPKSGWSKGPDGVITQWGIFGFPVGQTGTNVVFPLPFPARVESITLTMADIQESLLSPATMPAYGVNSTGTSRTGFTARMSGAGGFNLCYIAKGR
ncbi:TPA: phage tail protein [Escherichia coli]|nr:phage tail protein [Escherichia coli]